MPDMILTEEIKQKLKKAGALGFQIEATFKYVPKAYREKNGEGEYIIPKDLWPIFVLKGIDGVESALLEDDMHGKVTYDKIEKDGKFTGTSIQIESGKVRLNTLCKCLITWKNFRNVKGELIKAPEEDKVHGGLKRSALRILHPDLQTELHNAITEQTILNDEELQGLK